MTSRPSIERYMTPNPLTLSPGMEVTRAAAFLIRNNISGAPVTDDTGRLVGILTAKDCFRAVLHATYYQELGGTVASYMVSPVETLDAGLDIIAAAERFLATPYRRFPVMKEGRIAGIITRLDLLRAFGREW
jgi:CBS domain-containing protein